MTRQLKEVMTGGAEVIYTHTSIQEAAQKMNQLDVGMLPVCEGDRLRGTLTDRDITVRAVSKGLDLDKTKVRDIMTRGIVYCFEDESVKKAAKLMQSQQIRRLLILDRNKRLCGVVSLGDLAVETGGMRFAGKTLEKVSQSSSRASQHRRLLPRQGIFSFLSPILGSTFGTALGALVGSAAVVVGYRFFNPDADHPRLGQSRGPFERAA